MIARASRFWRWRNATEAETNIRTIPHWNWSLDFEFCVEKMKSFCILYLPKSNVRITFTVKIGFHLVCLTSSIPLDISRSRHPTSWEVRFVRAIRLFVLQIYSSGEQFTLWPHVGLETRHNCANFSFLSNLHGARRESIEYNMSCVGFEFECFFFFVSFGSKSRCGAHCVSLSLEDIDCFNVW